MSQEDLNKEAGDQNRRRVAFRNIHLGSKLKVEGTKKREHRKSFVLGRMAVSEEGCQEGEVGTSPVVQWLRLHVHDAGDPGSIPAQATMSPMLQPATKTWHSQTHK